MSKLDLALGEIPESVEAEAAAWIARLHNGERTQKDETSFQRWLAEKPMHKFVFEGMTDAWNAAGRLESDVLLRQRLAPLSTAKGLPATRVGTGRQMFALAAALIAAAIGLVILRDAGLSTSIGERREITLADGSRLTLNTATHVHVEFDDRQRLVRLRHGEAFFDVTKRPGKPFVVATPNGQITALGTSFSVRAEEGKTEIILVDGKVSVSGDSPTILSPGQRITLEKQTAPKVDWPEVEKVTAWRQGLIALEKIPLADAVAEMNRYSTVKLIVAPGVGQLIRVSGIFHAGDSEDFAQGLADSHGLKVSRRNDRIVLSGK